MANPPSRRTSSSSSSSSPYSGSNYLLPISDTNNNNNQFQSQTTAATATIRLVNSIKIFLRKPHAFPFLLSIFLFLTWVSLRIQHHQHPRSDFNTWALKLGNKGKDEDANLVRFHSMSSSIVKDKRGWFVDPVSLGLQAGISGGATNCASVHIGEIRAGGVRGNHRHHSCNETFVIWGAKTLFRLENNLVDKGYAEVIVGADEVAVAASPSGKAHALVNLDALRSTFFLGCQDNIINYNDSTSDFNVWKDI
ncbi:uncharacterized protein [Coffea arabica]|uniref:Uncharacterized protein n=1 Tax=Coffea arabica TaxID=13443 RepID=A0ABM4UX65_COFAR|nr:uncharacterized protein LOC113697506 [Coffea arabica]